jgi:ubiquinol-cytochrome c reductase cytochrome c subunit
VTEEAASHFDEDADLAAELGFDPAVAMTGADAGAADQPVPARRRRPRGQLRRKLSSAAVLVGSLALVGGAYSAFASTSGAAGGNAQAIAEGKQLYQVSCITCHGANLQGIEDRGVPLIGVGGAAAYFQVSTGRMPLTQQGTESVRKTPKFDDKQARALAAYIQSVGGGPTIPQGVLRGNSKSIAEGGELFRINCASCHGTTFKGAPLSAGKAAPSLNAATDAQIYAAMLTGPESMPVFSNNTLTPDQKRAIIAYVQTIKASNDPGGSGIGRIGPVSEAIVIWVAGVGALMAVILWIGAKSQ